MIGAVTDDLRSVGRDLTAAATELENNTAALTGILSRVNWVGPVASSFEGRWQNSYQPGVMAMAATLRSLATELDDNATDQDLTSSAGVCAMPSGGWLQPLKSGGSQPSEGESDKGADDSLDKDILGLLGDLFGTLGLTHGQIGDLTKLLKEFDDIEDFKKVVGLLTNDKFVAGMGVAGKVLDVGGFLIGFLQDFQENSNLPTDERIIHALADGGIRLAIGTGIDLLVQAAINALLPGVGTVVGHALGFAIDPIVGVIVDYGLEKTDLVDRGADLVVETYRKAKVMADVIIDGAHLAWDGGKKLAGWGVDGGKWVLDGTVDAGQAILNTAGDAGQAIGGFADAAVGEVKDFTGGAINAVEDVAGGTINTVGGLIPGWLK